MKWTPASLSETRLNRLQAAGIKFEARSSLVNEEKSKAELRGDGLAAHAVAKGLAEMKALSIDATKVLVIGSDQTLAFGDLGMPDKPASPADAPSQLKPHRGKHPFLNLECTAAGKGRIAQRTVESG